MPQYLLPLMLFAAGMAIGAWKRWIPRSGVYALGLCALPVFGFWLSSQFC
jgi:hypothetical protein